jgi:hypothetical protein
MASKGQLTGMQGVYLVAAELASRGFIASPTSRSAAGADLLVTDQLCRNAWTLQVKTNSKRGAWWLVGKSARAVRSPTLLYVLVNLNAKGAHEFYVMPSMDLARRVKTFKRPNSVFYGVSRKVADQYRDNWKIFGKA